MFDKTINVKTIDLSGVNLPSDDEATCDLIYSALSTTYGFPIYMENFKVNGVKHDSVLVNSIILENQTIINLNDCHLIVTPTGISVGKGVYGASLESIIDRHGNPRFVEGDITMNTIEGITQTYGKWSLSGTHLMIVVTLNMVQGTTLSAGIPICDINLPKWILDKINPLWNTYISFIEFSTIGAGGDTKITMSLRKETLNKLTVFNSVVAYTSERNEAIRLQFDLLIDADYDE